MSPQPAAPPKPAAEQTPAQRQIHRAMTLERERAELQERIGKNRDYLRLMDANEELSTTAKVPGTDLTESQWLAAFYPEKEKGERRSADEIEATRKVKEAARKG